MLVHDRIDFVEIYKTKKAFLSTRAAQWTTVYSLKKEYQEVLLSKQEWHNDRIMDATKKSNN